MQHTKKDRSPIVNEQKRKYLRAKLQNTKYQPRDSRANMSKQVSSWMNILLAAAASPVTSQIQLSAIRATDSIISSNKKQVEEQSVPSEEQSVPSEEQSVPSKEQSVLSEEQSVPSEEQSVPSGEQSVPSQNLLVLGWSGTESTARQSLKGQWIKFSIFF